MGRFLIKIYLLKLPFQIFFWKNITATSLQTDLFLLPALAMGFLAGLKIVSVIKDSHYRKVVIVLTMAGALIILLR